MLLFFTGFLVGFATATWFAYWVVSGPHVRLPW
jgi:hypothetical protein